MVGGRAGWRSWTPPGAKCKTGARVLLPSSSPFLGPPRRPQFQGAPISNSPVFQVLFPKRLSFSSWHTKSPILDLT